MPYIVNTFTLSQLFANNNEQFVVPSYQRRYAWKFQHVKALIDDIRFLRGDEGHLFGMLILHAGGHHGGLNQLEIADGQQRLTTLTILLKSAEKAYRKLNMPELANEILRIIQCQDPARNRKNKLRLGELDNSDYCRIINEETLNDLGNLNLKFAIEYFDECLSEFNGEELNSFINKLINIARIIRLDVTMVPDAYKLFETINNRGLKLSPTDIIKNFLLGHASTINDPEILENVKSIWTRIIINLDGINTDNFFRQYMCSILRRKVTERNIIPEFKAYYIANVQNVEDLREFGAYAEDEEGIQDEDEAPEFTDGNLQNIHPGGDRITIIQYLENIKRASDIYKNIYKREFREGFMNRHITNLWRIQCVPSFIFLMHFLQGDYSRNTRVRILKMIETFMLRKHICERRTGENDQIFSHLVNVLDEEDENHLIEAFKSRIRDYYPEDQEFREKFPHHQFSGKVEERARYVLEQLEYQRRGNGGEILVDNPENVHLEHIIPQAIHTPRAIVEFGNWIEYLGENSISRHKRYVARIGNLTLLGAPLNIRASNNPFNMKKSSYSESELLITHELADLDDFKFDQVDVRGDAIADTAVQIWRIDFGETDTE